MKTLFHSAYSCMSNLFMYSGIFFCTAHPGIWVSYIVAIQQRLHHTELSISVLALQLKHTFIHIIISRHSWLFKAMHNVLFHGRYLYELLTIHCFTEHVDMRPWVNNMYNLIVSHALLIKQSSSLVLQC